MKVLYVTTIIATMSFFPEHIKMLIDEGHEVEFASSYNPNDRMPEFYKDSGIKIHNICFSRSPLSKDNITACRQLNKLLKTEHYDIIHTHTPNASACVRLIGKKFRKTGTKIVYTAHGFHFYKGAPLKNWLLYYPVEWLCAHWTDTLITINQEDYERAQKHMHAKRVEYVPGVGLDIEKFRNVEIDREEKRKELNIPGNALLLISVGELNKNKNHEVVIRAIAELNNPRIHYAIAGEGENAEYLRKMTNQLDVSDKVHLLGFRNDVKELYKASDVFVFPSVREGLSVALMEAMSNGLPCIVSKIRGNTDLIVNEEGGYLCDPSKSEDFKEKIELFISNKETITEMGEYNKERINNFSIEIVNSKMHEIYSNVIGV